MTNAELITELQKLPGHYVAMVVTPCISRNGLPDDPDFSFISDVTIETNMGDLGCVVAVIAEGV